MSSGVIPQISIIFGPCAGGAVYSPALTDFTIMVKEKGYMFLTGPRVIKAVTHENVSTEDLGGAYIHTTRSGVAHHAVSSDHEAIEFVKDMLSYFPQNNRENPPFIESSDPSDRTDKELNRIIPEISSKVYDMKQIIKMTVDSSIFLEVHAKYATIL
jgi:propionyl-CoA carboxylase beta chain